MLGFTWAPDVRYLDGRYVMYYDSIAQPSLYFDAEASGFSQYAQCIGVATSKAPGGPFVGENAPLIRQKVCECLAWLGADLDLDANRQGAGLVSTPTSRLALWVIPTDEEQMIAAHTRAFV